MMASVYFINLCRWLKNSLPYIFLVVVTAFVLRLKEPYHPIPIVLHSTAQLSSVDT